MVVPPLDEVQPRRVGDFPLKLDVHVVPRQAGACPPVQRGQERCLHLRRRLVSQEQRVAVVQPRVAIRRLVGEEWVVAGVPAAVAGVEPADEQRAPVDDRELLVVREQQGTPVPHHLDVAVQALQVRLRVEGGEGGCALDLLVEQDADADALERLLLQQVVQAEVLVHGRGGVGRAPQEDVRRQPPRGHEDLVLGGHQGVAERREELLPVHVELADARVACALDALLQAALHVPGLDGQPRSVHVLCGELQLQRLVAVQRADLDERVDVGQLRDLQKEDHEHRRLLQDLRPRRQLRLPKRRPQRLQQGRALVPCILRALLVQGKVAPLQPRRDDVRPLRDLRHPAVVRRHVHEAEQAHLLLTGHRRRDADLLLRPRLGRCLHLVQQAPPRARRHHVERVQDDVAPLRVAPPGHLRQQTHVGLLVWHERARLHRGRRSLVVPRVVVAAPAAAAPLLPLLVPPRAAAPRASSSPAVAVAVAPAPVPLPLLLLPLFLLLFLAALAGAPAAGCGARGTGVRRQHHGIRILKLLLLRRGRMVVAGRIHGGVVVVEMVVVVVMVGVHR
eukprot:Rhum_TRINITY_DN14440_c10_g3::Rhum_TRINITY_DN14440_c10_g3_i1::g.90668::m.90668